MRIVVALGGNALLQRGEALTAENQARNIAVAATALVPLFEAGHEIILTHGNGPQVGLLAIQSASTPETPTALDVLDAESAGMIGYLLAQGLRNALPAGRTIATLLSEVRVDSADPAFVHPTKPIGRVFTEIEASALAAERGWHVAQDGKTWRRVVASPKPLEILGLEAIRTLIDHQITVICLGGGGIPVVRDPEGKMHGIEAVIDKDHASALLARDLKADWLLMLTDVEAIYTGWGTDHAEAIRETTPEALAALSFPAGSMGPKVAAAVAFVSHTAGRAGIGRMQDASAILAGTAGSRIAVR
ncbi:MAG: carbamate kinase [Rhizobiales bacterium PAR1]|nr:MAG: carbamate kinase [Rhizobiales bacterium PAR1]